MRKTKVLIYAGGNRLLPTTDEDLHTEGAWLRTDEYDKQTRAKIDELWEEAATNPMWYALGARMIRQQHRGQEASNAPRHLEHSTITGIEGDTWEITDKQGNVDKVTKGNVLNALHHYADDIRWATTTSESDTRRIKRLLSAAQAKTATTTWTKMLMTQRHPTGTVIWKEPNPTTTGDLTHGCYWYTTSDTTLDGMYRTANGKGQRMEDLNGDQIHKMAVHTRETGVCRHEMSPHMRKAAVRLNGDLAVVWSTGDWEKQNHASRRILVYAGGKCLLAGKPEDMEEEGA